MIGRDVESYRAGIASDTTGKLAMFLQLRGRAHCEADEGARGRRLRATAMSNILG